jgi:tape measure domain-containing protein
MKTLSQQATQMAAKPSVAWADFKLMLEQTPAGIAAVAKEMGMTTSELVTNVQDGKIATDKFFDAIAKVGTNKAFTELATEAKTVGQAMDGLKETVGNKLTPAFEVLNKKGISIIESLGTNLSKIDADALANKVSNLVDKVSNFAKKAGKYLSAVKEAFSGVGTEVWSAVKEIGSALLGMTGEFGSTESIEGFKSVMKGVADVIKSVAGFSKKHASAIATFIKWLPAIVIGIKGIKIASAVAPGVIMFAKGIGSLVGKGIDGIASKLFDIS